MSAVTLSERRQIARKPHGCNVCLGIISPGDSYVVQNNADGGEMWQWKAHGLCDKAFHLAWDPAWHDWDDNPSWEEIAPFVLRFFETIVGAP